MRLLLLWQRVTSKFTKTYGSDLEEYIISHDPKNEGDVERLTQQYQYGKQYYQGL